MRSLASTRPRAPSGDESRSRYHLNPSRHGTHGTIIRVVENGGRTLDVGCASGYLGAQLAAQGCTMWGVDLDEEALIEAAPHYLEVRRLDLESERELPWPRLFFDTIIAADVVEHLKEPVVVLEVLRNHLRPGGRLVVSVPNVAHASVRIPLVLGRFRYRETGILDRTHLRLFTFRTARELVEAAGFRVASVCGGTDHFGHLVNAPGIGLLTRGLLAYSIVLVARPG